MPVSMKVVCDTCGQEKKEANHWWVTTGAVDLLVEPFKEPTKYPPTTQYHCSESCVVKRVSEFMRKLVEVVDAPKNANAETPRLKLPVVDEKDWPERMG